MAVAEALVETWTLYGVGTLIIWARVLCRWRMVGVYNFKPDDYLVWLAWITYTVMTVAAHIVGGVGDMHALTLAQRQALSDSEAATLVWGTQWFCAGVATYVTFIWLLKLNMLFLYQRVVNGLWVAHFIRPAMAFVGATYVVIMLILFCSCRPYYRMWIVYPDQGEVCKPQATVNLVPALVMNILTDACIMIIPAPVILPIQTTLWKKLGLLALFGAGFFIMIAAVLRVVMVLVLGNGATAAIWSCREDFVAILVGQAIMLRPLFSARFWTPGGYYKSSKGGYNSTGNTPAHMSIEMNNKNGSSSKRSQLMSSKRRKDPYSLTAALATVNDEGGDGTGSTDKIIEPTTVYAQYNVGKGDLESGTAPKSPTMSVHVSTEVRVDTATVEEIDRETGGRRQRSRDHGLRPEGTGYMSAINEDAGWVEVEDGAKAKALTREADLAVVSASDDGRFNKLAKATKASTNDSRNRNYNLHRLGEDERFTLTKYN